MAVRFALLGNGVQGCLKKPKARGHGQATLSEVLPEDGDASPGSHVPTVPPGLTIEDG